MSERFQPNPKEFQRSVSLLCTKIQTVAMRCGVSGVECSDLEGSLAVMERTVRDRVKLMLEGIRIQTEFSDYTMSFAARYLLSLAHSIWEENPHPATHLPSASGSLARGSSMM